MPKPRSLKGRRTTWQWGGTLAVLKTPCVLSQLPQSSCAGGSRGAGVQETEKELRAYSELAATEGKGHGLGPPRIAAFTNLLQALSERGSTVERQTRREWQILIKSGTIWNWMEISIWYLIATWPKCTSTWDNTENTFEWHSDNRSESSSVKPQAGLWNGHCQQQSNIIEKKVNFVAASSPDSLIRPRVRQDDWRQGIASDEELMDRAIGKLEGTGGLLHFWTVAYLDRDRRGRQGLSKRVQKGFKPEEVWLKPPIKPPL